MQNLEVIDITMNDNYDHPKYKDRKDNAINRAKTTMLELESDIYVCACGKPSVTIDDYGRKCCLRCHNKKFINLKVKNPERNSPCPCGSGKKYKKCCY